MNGRSDVTDFVRSGGMVSNEPKRENGTTPEPEFVELHCRLNLTTGEMEMQVEPTPMVQNRLVMYGLLGMLRDIIYRQQLPGELAVIQQAAARAKQIVVAPGGSVPPFPRRS